MSTLELPAVRAHSPINGGAVVYHQVQIRPRDTFKFFVRADLPLDTLHFSFYTRRKNIAFGLFYLHLPSIDEQDGSSLPAGKIRELLLASRENVKIEKIGQEGILARTRSTKETPTSKYCN
jgi:hypothetical protein